MLKILFIFFALNILTNHAFGQGDLSAHLKGQGSSVKINVGQIQLPNNQATKTGAVAAFVETGNNNILANPSFEHSTATTSWTTTGCSAASESTNVVHGLKSLAITCSAQTLSTSQDSSLYATQFGSTVQGLAGIRIKNNIAGVYVCARKAGVTSSIGSSECAPVSSSDTWGWYKIPFPLGATSNGLALVTSGNVSGTLYIDDSFLGPADVLDTQPIVGPLKSCTITGSWVSNTTYTCLKQQIGDSYLYDVLVSLTGAPTATALTLTLPTGDVIDTTKLVSTDTTNSNGLTDSFTSIKDSGTANYTISQVAYASSTSVKPTADNGSSLASDITNTSPITFANGDFVRVSFKVPIVGLASFTNTYVAGCVDDISCTNIFSAKVSSAGVVSAENLNFINGNASIASTSRYTMTWNTNVFPVAAPNCVAIATDALGTSRWIQFNSVSTTTGVVEVQNGSGGNTATPFTILCSRSTDFMARQNIVGSFQARPSSRAFASSTSISGSLATIVWTTEDYDTHNALSSGVYTCPETGKYQVNAALALSGTFALNNVNIMEIQKNGTAVSAVNKYTAAVVTNEAIQISDTISCVAGDTLRIQASSAATGPAIVASNTRNFLSIAKIGME